MYIFILGLSVKRNSVNLSVVGLVNTRRGIWTNEDGLVQIGRNILSPPTSMDLNFIAIIFLDQYQMSTILAYISFWNHQVKINEGPILLLSLLRYDFRYFHLKIRPWSLFEFLKIRLKYELHFQTKYFWSRLFCFTLKGKVRTIEMNTLDSSSSS